MTYEVKLMHREQAVKTIKCRDKQIIKYWIDFWKNLYQEKFINKKLCVQIYPIPTEKWMDRIKLPDVDNR